MKQKKTNKEDKKTRVEINKRVKVLQAVIPICILNTVKCGLFCSSSTQHGFSQNCLNLSTCFLSYQSCSREHWFPFNSEVASQETGQLTRYSVYSTDYTTKELGFDSPYPVLFTVPRSHPGCHYSVIGGSLAGCPADGSPTCRADDKNAWSLNSIPPYIFKSCC